MKREDFKYAKLYDAEENSYCTDFSKPNLVMGPETQKRFDQNTDDVAVTVCCITYNHEKYIRQALDGFVMQKTNFKFKVFVGEDHGPDGTADIIREYAEKYPDIIVPFIREENLGGMGKGNLIDLCNRANSPYIAFCEGDDFWIDEYKLQKQFDYMQKHEDIRMCYTSTEVLAPNDWHLNDYYKSNRDGKIIIPYCAPGFKKRDFYTVNEFLVVFPNHTSSAFYRWNYDLEIPDWYYEGIIGDIPMTIMQMGMGKAVYLPDVTSVYRRSDVGIFMSSDSQEHFANTRLDYVRFIKGMREHFKKYYDGAYDKLFRYRITKEIANYLSVAKSYQNTDMIAELFKRYPDEAFEAMHTFLGSYNIYSSLQGKMSNKDLAHLYTTRRGVFFAYPGLKLYSLLSSLIIFVRKAKNFIFTGLRSLIKFWNNTKVPKQKNLWAFTGFRNANYMDNTMYFYEYVLKHHPEINAVWFTDNVEIVNKLKSEGKPVMLIGSKESEKLMAQAEIAVTDHFATTDYKAEYGFNNKTKVVQLWHGVGFKAMGDGKSAVKNTTERGVRYSDDILIQDGDNIFKKLIKKIKYYFLAPFRERFETYFLFVCPGQERIDMIAKIWHIPMENCFMAGHPRNLPVYCAEISKDPVKVMYAPTYRFDYQHETEMVNEILASCEEIQKAMEEVNGEFYIRLHPHTWRNYKGKIMSRIKNFDRILLDESKDVYEELGSFSVMISDYSSIALDFAQLDRPTIFHCADYNWFIKNEAGFNLDFPSVIPGPMTANWNETLEEIKEYIANPQKDSDLRKEKIKYFFDAEVNGPDNSERIIEEIKKRINLD